MKRPTPSLVPHFTLGLGALALWACAKTPREDPPPKPRAEVPTSTPSKDADDAPAPCLRTIELTHHASVLEEQRSIGPHRDDFQRTFQSVHVDPETYTPVEATSGIEVAETPVFWWTPAKDAAVVHGAIAGELRSRDAFVLRPGERVTLGRLDEISVDRISGLDWLELMVRAHVIGTYAHLQSALCVVEQKGAPLEGFDAEVKGEHVYFTNEENRDRYRFAFRIEDRVMTLEGLEP